MKTFGAKGDGVTDDTQAFLDALAQVKAGAIEVPPSRYRITRPLEITRPNIVLRGAGPDKTVLLFPKTLNDIKPNWGTTTTGQRTSNYSWSGGFITLRGSFQRRRWQASSRKRNEETPRFMFLRRTRCAPDSGWRYSNPTRRTIRWPFISTPATPCR